MFKGKYGELVPHQTMIQDEYRTNSYLKAIDKAVSPGDIVIDFGSGTGILAMAAAQVAGRVFAIERNPATADMLSMLASTQDTCHAALHFPSHQKRCQWLFHCHLQWFECCMCSHAYPNPHFLLCKYLDPLG